ncbi:MAG TPA: hypothetical protein VNM48_22965 [Chloroflexota bacterium]|nr:hypothetical protein [Chloroflexota bacterium]
MSRFYHVQVDINKEALTDAYLAYVTDPRASRNEHHQEVLEEGPIPQTCLEAMVLDGVDDRRVVAEFVDWFAQFPTGNLPAGHDYIQAWH